MIEIRKTADELTEELKDAVRELVEAKTWIDRASMRERQATFRYEAAVKAVEQRMLERAPSQPSSNTDGEQR